MKGSVLIQPMLHQTLNRERVVYTTSPYKIARGVTRAMQRFAAIALTTVGTDALRPWLGTELPVIPRMNVADEKELQLLVNDELARAIAQFFTLQNQENYTSDVDVMASIDVTDITIGDNYAVSAHIRFTPRVGEAITISLEV